MKKNYSKHSLNQNNKRKFVTDWKFKEGVIQIASDKWICRVKEVIEGTTLPKYTTLSQHNTEEGAQKAYDNFNKK